METTLHRQLKDYFRQSDSQLEVRLGRYRIDVVNGNRLVEIQRSGLASIRAKVQKLLEDGHVVDVVKPLIRRKRLIKLDSIDGREIDRRWSPKKGSELSIFDELLYFTRVFPHPNLTLIAPLIDIEEVRYPGQGKRRRRRRKNAFQIKDQKILEMGEMVRYESIRDLQKLLPASLPKQFDTAELAEGLGVPRWHAQQIAYVLRKTSAAIETGKRGNAIVCRLATTRESSKQLAAKRPTRKPKCKPGQTLLDGRTRIGKTTSIPKPKRRKTTVRKPAKASSGK
jgi:hypothetical protein